MSRKKNPLTWREKPTWKSRRLAEVRLLLTADTRSSFCCCIVWRRFFTWRKGGGELKRDPISSVTKLVSWNRKMDSRGKRPIGQTNRGKNIEGFFMVNRDKWTVTCITNWHARSSLLCSAQCAQCARSIYSFIHALQRAPSLGKMGEFRTAKEKRGGRFHSQLILSRRADKTLRASGIFRGQEAIWPFCVAAAFHEDRKRPLWARIIHLWPQPRTHSPHPHSAGVRRGKPHLYFRVCLSIGQSVRPPDHHTWILRNAITRLNSNKIASIT